MVQAEETARGLSLGAVGASAGCGTPAQQLQVECGAQELLEGGQVVQLNALRFAEGSEQRRVRLVVEAAVEARLPAAQQPHPQRIDATVHSEPSAPFVVLTHVYIFFTLAFLLSVLSFSLLSSYTFFTSVAYA
jgi:hypothetical protein